VFPDGATDSEIVGLRRVDDVTSRDCWPDGTGDTGSARVVAHRAASRTWGSTCAENTESTWLSRVDCHESARRSWGFDGVADIGSEKNLEG